MAKTNTPFFALGSRGTIAVSLTSQKRGSATILRQKPVPTDPYTLPQAYQRWLYEDYAHLWTQQVEATRRAYAADGSRFHLTGFQYWMKYQLTNLPDIAGYWKLDEKAGALAYDSSRYLNNGVIIGATPADGLIYGAQDFDGLNDHLRIPHIPPLAPVNDGTIEFFINPDKVNAIQYVIDKDINVDGLFSFIIFADATMDFIIKVNGNLRVQNIPISALTWSHWLGTWSTTTNQMQLFKNGQLAGQTPLGGATPTDAGKDIYLGARYPGLLTPLEGYLDHLIIYNRALDTTEALRHSLRRYPA